MKKYILVLSIFIIIVFLLPTNNSNLDSNDSNIKIEWNEFVWIEGIFGEEYYSKAAMLIPFRFNGIDEDYYLQLDTGASSVLYGNSFYDIGPSFGMVKKKDERPSIVSIDGSLSSYVFTGKHFEILEDYGPSLDEEKGEKYKLIGSLGLDFLKNKVLIIDFPEERFAILNNQEDIPIKIRKNSGFLNIKYKNNKIYLKSKIGPKNLSLIYDTGSSIFDIVTSQEMWTSLTNVKSDRDVKLLEVNSWGSIVQLKGARAENDWEIGHVNIKQPLIFHEISGLENLNFKSIKADGLLGNAIFYDNHIITIDLINKKFGIMEAEPSSNHKE